MFAIHSYSYKRPPRIYNIYNIHVLIVQSMYEKIRVNPPLIATEGFSTVLGTENIPL